MSTPKFNTPTTDKQNDSLKKSLGKHLSGRLKELRTKRGMTQQELCEKTGLHLTYVAHLEAGKYHPSVFVMWKIANVLNVKIDDFLS